MTTTSSDGPTRSRLTDIAAAAGVSVATVSKVVNGRPDVSPATRAAVEAHIARHHYVSPSSRRTATEVSTVEFLLPDDLSAYSTLVLSGVVEAGRRAGVSVVVGGFLRGSTRTAPRAWARSLLTAGRGGVIAVTAELSDSEVAALHSARLPVVVIDPLGPPRHEVASVASTNFAGGWAVAEHLIRLRHREIAYVGGPPRSACNQARVHGYRAALEAAGLAPRPGFVLQDTFHVETGRRLGRQVLDRAEPPTAVVAANDEVALGLLEAARVLGLRVPRDLSITGFDDSGFATRTAPPLTTVRQPLREMGTLALRNLLQLATGEPLGSHHVELATELVVRGSTGPATDRHVAFS